ncbi:MAG: hypothetical protein PVI72_15230 [Desulfobacterales bacterium]
MKCRQPKRSPARKVASASIKKKYMIKSKQADERQQHGHDLGQGYLIPLLF